jgi:hypothetical protein
MNKMCYTIGYGGRQPDNFSLSFSNKGVCWHTISAESGGLR